MGHCRQSCSRTNDKHHRRDQCNANNNRPGANSHLYRLHVFQVGHRQHRWRLFLIYNGGASPQTFRLKVGEFSWWQGVAEMCSLRTCSSETQRTKGVRRSQTRANVGHSKFAVGSIGATSPSRKPTSSSSATSIITTYLVSFWRFYTGKCCGCRSDATFHVHVVTGDAASSRTTLRVMHAVTSSRFLTPSLPLPSKLQPIKSVTIDWRWLPCSPLGPRWC